MTLLEIAANGVATTSILLAARNSIHTWWTGIIGCALFALLFYQNQLFADVTLQLVFIATSLLGWLWWARGDAGSSAPVQHARPAMLALLGSASIIAALGYGAILHFYTDAYAPFVDSFVLTLSLLAQFLLMRRLVETWMVWLAVNTIAIPLFATRGLYLTASLYTCYWFNAWYGLWRWRREMRQC